MHQQVLQCRLHIRCATALGIGYEARERHVLQHRLPYIVLKVFDLLGLEIGQHTNVFLKVSLCFSKKPFVLRKTWISVFVCVHVYVMMLSVCLHASAGCDQTRAVTTRGL